MGNDIYSYSLQSWLCPNCLDQDSVFEREYHNTRGVTLAGWRSIIRHLVTAYEQENYDELESWLLIAEKKANNGYD